VSQKRTEIWAGLIVLAIGVIPVALVGLWVYMRATATPLHPNPQDAPSVTRSGPLPKWSAAVDHGRQIVRAALTEQNLTGQSAAVDFGGSRSAAGGRPAEARRRDSDLGA
jgi:hypothetical protein